MSSDTLQKFSDGEIYFWIEQESIHIKAVDKFGDPVELTKEQALNMSDSLRQLAERIMD